MTWRQTLMAVCGGTLAISGVAQPPALTRIGETPPCQPHFISSSIAWCGSGDPVRLWTTGDAGKTWSEIPPPPGGASSFDLVLPESERSGWVVVFEGHSRTHKAFRTDDAGGTWTPVWTYSGDVSPSIRIADRTLWLGGSIQPSGEAPDDQRPDPVIRWTRDGKQWNEIRLETPNGRDVSIRDIRFATSKRGLAVAAKSAFFTEDSGETWKRSEFRSSCISDQGLLRNAKYNADWGRASDQEHNQPPAISWDGEQAAWLLFPRGTLLHSEDAGSSWCQAADLNGLWHAEGLIHLEIHFESALRGLAMNYGQLFMTTDGGKRWAKISGDLYIEDFQCPAPGKCLLTTASAQDPWSLYRLTW